MNKLCPHCRNVVMSLMLLDPVKGPEYHCERCARTVVPVKPETPAPKLLQAALN